MPPKSSPEEPDGFDGGACPDVIAHKTQSRKLTESGSVKISRAHSEQNFILEDSMVEFLLLRTRGKGESQDVFYLRGAAVERHRFVNPLARRVDSRAAQHRAPADRRRLNDLPRFRNCYSRLDIPISVHTSGRERIGRMRLLMTLSSNRKNANRMAEPFRYECRAI
jgi:hypothetical protein